MTARYALYLAPPPGSALWRFGSRVIGRDGATGEAIEGYAPAGFSPQAWWRSATDPRRYGFHATLKAPFRLAEGRSLAELEAAARAFASGCEAFDIGPLRVSAIKLGGGDLGFVALTPVTPPPALAALEARALREFDVFRAPASADEIARRRPDRLTARQRDNLARWGYPLALEDFRLHFTLSGALENPEQVATLLAEDFAGHVGAPDFTVDALVLFAQADGGEFRVLSRFQFRAAADSPL